MSPSPWWKEFGYNKRDHRDASLLPETRDRTGVPFYVDTVCWPYTLGVPAVKGLVDKEAITQGRNHWTPYRITGKGRETGCRCGAPMRAVMPGTKCRCRCSS